MRRVVPALAAVSLIALFPSMPAGSQEVPAPVLKSDNISLLTTLPNPGVIGARFKGDYMYVTTLSGLTIYDIQDPAAPVEVGRLTLPHFQNEDVDLAGDILLISNDAAESTGILYVIDISDPAAPTLRSQIQMGGNPVEGGPGHTASCILQCKFAWITDAGRMRAIDLRDPNAPKDLGTFETPIGGLATHDVQTDGNGLAWIAGFNGTAIYRIPKSYEGPGDEKLLAQTDESAQSTYDEEFGAGGGSNPNDFIHHNSRRLKNSSVAYITEEDYTRPACKGAGSFQTWRVPTKDGIPNGKDLTLLDQWETEFLSQENPRDMVAAMCSAHYFDVANNLVAQGWYEQGVRFLDVSDPKNIRQVGYFIPPTAMTWAAYFSPTDQALSTVYVLDASRGIDVLSVVRPAKGSLSAPRVPCGSDACRDRYKLPKAVAPIKQEWRAGAPAIGLQDPRYGFACRISAG